MGSEWRVIVCALVVGGAIGCLKPAEVTQCGDFTCGLGAICSPDGTSCVAPETVYACTGLADSDRCTYTGVSAGVCTAGICIAGGCGNGVVEAALGEICDDGNLVSLDGCRSDCKSLEMCGDGIQDLPANEYCDCGTATSPSTLPTCDGPNSDAPGAICRTDCTLARCGDAVLDPGEICDDGNTVAGDGCRADCGGRWTAMASMTYQRLNGVWGASATAVFAVGNGRVLRYDGSSWSVMPILPAMQTSDLKFISGTSASDFWVASDAQVFHLTGSTWTEMTPPSFQVAYLLMTSATDGWLVGTDPSKNPLTYRWNGSAWQSFSNPLAGVSSMFARSPDNAWAAADFGTQLLHFNGTAWQNVLDGASSPVKTVFITGSPTDLLGVRPLNVSNGTSRGYARVTGATWPAFSECCSDIPTMGALGGTAGDYILVGDEGKIMRFDGATWTIESASTSQKLTGVWGAAPGRVFVVGENGTILY